MVTWDLVWSDMQKGFRVLLLLTADTKKSISRLPSRCLISRCRDDSWKGMGACSSVLEGNAKEAKLLIGCCSEEYMQYMLPKSEPRNSISLQFPSVICWTLLPNKQKTLLCSFFLFDSLLLIFLDYSVVYDFLRNLDDCHPIRNSERTQLQRDQLVFVVFSLHWSDEFLPCCPNSGSKDFSACCYPQELCGEMGTILFT